MPGFCFTFIILCILFLFTFVFTFITLCIFPVTANVLLTLEVFCKRTVFAQIIVGPEWVLLPGADFELWWPRQPLMVIGSSALCSVFHKEKGALGCCTCWECVTALMQSTISSSVVVSQLSDRRFTFFFFFYFTHYCQEFTKTLLWPRLHYRLWK